MKVYGHYKKLSKTADDILVGVAAIVVGLDLLFIFASVVLRPFGMGFAMFQEFPRLWQSFLSFLVAGAVLKSKGHVSVDFLAMKLQGRALALLEIFLFCLTAVVSLILVTSSTQTLLALRDFGETTVSEIEFPVWYIYTAQVVGFVVLFLASIELVIDRFRLLIEIERKGNKTA